MLSEGGKPLTFKSWQHLRQPSWAEKGRLKVAWDSLVPSAQSQGPQVLHSPISHPPARYLAEEGSIEGDGVEAVNCPHRDIQVHQ